MTRSDVCPCGDRIVLVVLPEDASLWVHERSRSANCRHGGGVARPKGTR